MNPKVNNLTEKNDILTFTLSGINVSLANAVRRTILSDIPTVVFKTSPYEENDAIIISNTSRLHNEGIKQRLSCIPIHIVDLNMPLNNYLMELNVENITDTTIYATTKDFKIKNLTNDKYLTETDTLEIFPPNEFGDFIDFVRLRPKISNEIPGENIHLTCGFSIGTAKQDGMFNVVSTCSYGFTIDEIKIEEELKKQIQKWKNDEKEEKVKKDIAYETKNWRLLDGMRITKKDSFDFIIQTIGVFSNKELIRKACNILIFRLDELNTFIDTDKLDIQPSKNTMQYCFDIIIENEDYTIGKIVEYMLYSKFFEGLQTITYCGFKKSHPHDTQSIIRVAYRDNVDKPIVKQYLKDSIIDAINVFKNIEKQF
jgi:DNA-directed RNA polymerase subunit L